MVFPFWFIAHPYVEAAAHQGQVLPDHLKNMYGPLFERPNSYAIQLQNDRARTVLIDFNCLMQ
jgi:hypothetical protein